MTTFALDTATPDPALALVAGDEVLAEAWLGRAPGSGRRVLQAAHHLLAMAALRPADLSEVVVGVGPGGFTGIRIGIATALGLGQALRIPVHGASTLEALAQGMVGATRPGEALLVPIIDARRRQVFAAAYAAGADGSLTEVISPSAWDPTDLSAALAAAGPCVLAGDGADLVPVPAQGHRATAAADRIMASNLIARVRRGGALPVAPQYLRLPDAEENRLRREGHGAPA